MPDKAFAWMGRIKSVEREYTTIRRVIEHFLRLASGDPNLLAGGLRFRDITAAPDRLAETYVIRLFSQFEAALSEFLKDKKIKVPRNAEPLVNKVRDRIGIPEEDAQNVHKVREYRNFLVHNRDQPALPISIRESTRYLSTFLSRLQRTW